MKTAFNSFVFLIFSAFIFGQSGEISKKVKEFQDTHQQFNSYQIFSKLNDSQKTQRYQGSASDATVLKLNQSELSRLVKEAPELITVTIPYQNQEVKVQLYKQEILTDAFEAHTKKGDLINYTPGKYYRGIVSGNYNSLVALSFFENDVLGMISTQNMGNLNIGKSKDRNDFVVYSDLNLLGKNNFSCGADELEYNQQKMMGFSYDPSMTNKPDSDKCVRIYYEIAYAPYVQNGSNTTTTLNWITGIHNNIGTLYNNDNISVSLNAVNIWTTQDPYTGNYSENLYDFRDNTQNFNGDLAHLVNYPSTTSVAFVDSLCGSYKYAYSGIDMTYGQVPTYSWTIMAMTHEMGHSMGSYHTHDCVWNGDNTPIDGCGAQAGYPGNYPNGSNCSLVGPIPSSGTIMSYCHLIGGVGINFLNGFGTQPKAVIKNTINSKSCLGTNCISMSECNGTPTGGTVSVTPQSGGPGSSYTVSATSYTTGTGLQYQWQSKTNNNSWINMGSPSSTYSNYTATAPGIIGDQVQWRLKVTCTNSNKTAESTPATFTVTLSYCMVNFPSNVEPITKVTFAGIDNSSSATINGSPALEIFTSISGNVIKGNTYPIAVKGNTDGPYTNKITVYIDWNQDGVFDVNNEKYSIGNIYNSTGLDNIQATGNISIPNNALSGTTRMRVMKKYSTEAEPCNTSGYGQAEDYSLNVSSAAVTYTINTSSSPVVGGTTTGGGTYTEGDSVTVTATANQGYSFSKWSENGTSVSTNANYSFTATADRNLVAEFTIVGGKSYKITTKSVPAVGGTTSGGGTYPQGTQVTVSATANQGYVFSNWTNNNGVVVSTSASYSFTVTGKATLKANFIKQNFVVTTSSNPTLGGSATGSGTYAYNTKVTVKAIPNNGYVFVNWKDTGGNIVSTTKAYKFNITGNTNLIANFSPKNYQVTTIARPNAGGSVTGGGTYAYNSVATVSATTNNGYVFVNWTSSTGNVLSTNSSYSFTVIGKTKLYANFVKNVQRINEKEIQADILSFNYYPNPVKEVLHIDTNHNIQSIKVYNLDNQEIMNLNATKIVNGEVDVRMLPQGIYVFKIAFDNGKLKTFKVVKK